MRVDEVLAKLDMLERAAINLVRVIQETRYEFVESLDKPD